MGNFVDKGLSEHTVEITPPPGILDIEMLYKMVLSHLFGWDDNRDQWRQVSVDSDGRILVSTSPTKGDEANHSTTTVTTTATAILASNPDRTQMIIQNIGANNVYINFGEDGNTGTGMLLAPNVSFTDNIFTGFVSGITSSGTSSLRIVEMT